MPAPHRLATSVTDVLHAGRGIHDRGASLRVLEPAIDTNGPDDAFLDHLAAIASFEHTVRAERTTTSVKATKNLRFPR